jgi:hypothetical protein
MTPKLLKARVAHLEKLLDAALEKIEYLEERERVRIQTEHAMMRRASYGNGHVQ